MALKRIVVLLNICVIFNIYLTTRSHVSADRLADLIRRKNSRDPNKCGIDRYNIPDLEDICMTGVGPSTDAESDLCDKACCAKNYMTGHCTHNTFRVAMEIMNESQQYKRCVCTNDEIDIKCGNDGRFLGISCPFDESACRRKACRAGGDPSKARCGGFLKSKCKW